MRETIKKRNMLKSCQKKSVPYPLYIEPVLRIPTDPDSTGGSGSRKAGETSKEENMLARCFLWRAGRYSWNLQDLTETEKRYIYPVPKSMDRKLKKTCTMS
jgi:hypothetical protein